MPTQLQKLNELQKEVYLKIVSGKRLFSYQLNYQFVYVTEFNGTTLIHYTMKFNKSYCEIKYCLTAQNTPLTYNPQVVTTILAEMVLR